MLSMQTRGRGPATTLAVALVLVLGVVGQARAGGPVAVIYDSDIGPDCDDVSALCVLHALEQRGEAEILATICCTSSEWGAPCLDAINTFFGRPEIPVGTLKDPGFIPHSAFNQLLAERYPHRLRSGKDAPDATSVYRRILAARPERGVVIAAVGPLRNLRKLLDSGPDEHSPLGGRELVARKVRLLSCMGGWYPKVPDGWGPEWNFAQDEESTTYVLREWPTPITFSGAEIGSGIMTGRRVAVEGPEYHPLTLAFAVSPDVGFGADRASWDDTSVLVAVRDVGDVFESSPEGTALPGAKGANTFAEGPGRHHRYLKLARPVPEVEEVLEGLMVGAKEGPLVSNFNIATYAQDGMGTTSASDEEPPQGRKEHAFDRDPKTALAARSPGGWVQYQCPDGRKYAVSRYRITSGPDAPGHDPASWSLAGSNDGGTTWTDLDSRAGESFAGPGEAREFACRDAAPFNLYRLRFAGDRAVRVGGIELLESIANPPGVAVAGVVLDRTELSLAVADRAALNVGVLPGTATDKAVTWDSSDPAVATIKRIGKNTAVVSGLGVGTCVVTATTRDGRKTAGCRVAITPSTLPASWAYQEVNDPHVPGSAPCRRGEFRVIGGGRAIERWWLRVWDQFSLVCRARHGDGSISARITSLSAPSPHAIAGLMFRDSLARDSRFVMLGYSPSRELTLSWRDGPDEEGTKTPLGTYDHPDNVKLERRGETIDALVSKDGIDWGKPLGSHTGRSVKPVMKVGLCVCGRNNPTTGEAVFDYVIASQEDPR